VHCNPTRKLFASSQSRNAKKIVVASRRRAATRLTRRNKQHKAVVRGELPNTTSSQRARSESRRAQSKCAPGSGLAAGSDVAVRGERRSGKRAAQRAPPARSACILNIFKRAFLNAFAVPRRSRVVAVSRPAPARCPGHARRWTGTNAAARRRAGRGKCDDSFRPAMSRKKYADARGVQPVGKEALDRVAAYSPGGRLIECRTRSVIAVPATVRRNSARRE